MSDRTLPGWVGLVAGLAMAAVAISVSQWRTMADLLPKSADMAAWVQAIGSVAAIAIAVGGWLGELKRRAEADHTKIFIAERVVSHFHAFLLETEESLGGGYGTPAGKQLLLGSHRANILLQSGSLQEILHCVDNLQPSDMPTPETAGAWFSARLSVRAFRGRCEFQAAVVGSESVINFDDFWPGTKRAWGILQPAAQRLKSPFTPRWLYEFRREQGLRNHTRRVSAAVRQV